MPDIALQAKATQNAPLQYTIPGNQEILLKTMRARFDGTGAAGSFVPAIILRDPFGNEVGCYDLGTTLAAGASADATFFPGVKPAIPSPANLGGTALLYDFTVTVAQASIDTNVDGALAGLFRTDLTYLEVYLTGRTTGASVIDDVSFIFNNDSGMNYVRTFVGSAIAGSPIQGRVTAGATFAGVLPGANSNASEAGLCRLFIPNYSATVLYKIAEFTAWGVSTVAGGGTSTTFPFQIGLEAAMWKNTAAVTRIKAFCTGDIDPAGNLDVGTRLSVWGR